jgi:hypothetical protein
MDGRAVGVGDRVVLDDDAAMHPRAGQARADLRKQVNDARPPRRARLGGRNALSWRGLAAPAKRLAKMAKFTRL